MINGHEPVAVRTAAVAVVAAVVHLLVLLKVIDLDPAAETSIVTTVDLIAGLVIILLVRPKVTPVAHPVLTTDQVRAGTIYPSPGDEPLTLAEGGYTGSQVYPTEKDPDGPSA